MFLNQPVFQENKICNFKIHLISILNTKQTNDDIFSNKAEENFNLAKNFLKSASPTLINNRKILLLEKSQLLDTFKDFYFNFPHP